MNRITKFGLPSLAAACGIAIAAGGCGSTSGGNPTPTNTPQAGTAIVAGKVVKMGTPIAGAGVGIWQQGGGLFASASTDGNGNYSFTGVPLNPSGSDQFYVKWQGATPFDGSGGTVDYTEFGLVQTKAFTISASQTYSVQDFETGSNSLTRIAPAEASTQSLSTPVNFSWNAYGLTNLGYGFRVDSVADFGSNLYSYPASGWTLSMYSTQVSSANVTASSSQRFWRVAIDQSNANGIDVVASTKYWRVTLN